VDNKLYVITCISNPHQYKSRYRLFNQFKQYISQSEDVVLYTVELALGDQPFVVTDACNPTDIQIRGQQVFWHKENLLNIGIKSLPDDAKYVAWVDADVIFVNPNWVRDTIDALQEYCVVQMFSEYVNLGPKHQVLDKAIGFIAAWKDKNERVFDPNYGSARKGVTGLAWAARKETLDQLGGLLDWMIVGSSDWYMAYSLIGCSHQTNNRLPPLQEFQAKCDQHVNLNVGYVPGCAVHYWHGPKSKRGYNTRWRILTNNKFDPIKDLTKDSNGLYIVNPEKVQMLSELQNYFASRDEDSCSL
jgi:hypothetical protein